MRSFLLAPVVVVLASCVLASCLDWGAFGGGPGGREGEGEGSAGEGEGSEGEGSPGEGEGEGPQGPIWLVVSAPLASQAELASASALQLSSSNGRLFAVGQTHVFELVAEALQPVAELAVPCAGVALTGPVATDGTDLLVGISDGAVRFHADGSCDVPYEIGSVAVHAVTAFPGGALIFTGQTLHLVGSDGVDIDTHQFDTATPGQFFADTNADSVILVRGSVQNPGQAVRILKPADQLVIQPITDVAGVLAGTTVAGVNIDSSLGAPFLHVTVDTHTADLRVATSDRVLAVATDAAGEIAVVGPSALVAHANLTASPLVIDSLSGDRFGSLSRIVAAPGGEVWAVGSDVLLYWNAAAATAFTQPTIVKHVDVALNDLGPLVATQGKLFFSDQSQQLHRADVAGAAIEIQQLVDSVSLSPVTVQDSASRFAFLPAAGGAPARLVEATTFDVVAYELSDGLDAVTATLASGGLPVSSVSAIALLDDASKAAYVQFGTLFTCNVVVAAGVAPTVTCDNGRTIGNNGGAITVIDPSPGVDDETYVVSGNGSVSILNPGEAGRVFQMNVDAAVRPLLLQGCLLGFSSGSGGWSALDQAQPLSPAGRRGFPVGDVAVVGGRVLIVGGGGQAGQLASIPVPTTSTCDDAGGHPILDGAAMLGGEKRSQTDINAAAFLAGELYVLDGDGIVWHVPTP